jgi:hypothetical protein
VGNLDVYCGTSIHEFWNRSLGDVVFSAGCKLAGHSHVCYWTNLIGHSSKRTCPEIAAIHLETSQSLSLEKFSNFVYYHIGFGRAENRFRREPEEESPNTIGRDAA